MELKNSYRKIVIDDSSQFTFVVKSFIDEEGNTTITFMSENGSFDYYAACDEIGRIEDIIKFLSKQVEISKARVNVREMAGCMKCAERMVDELQKAADVAAEKAEEMDTKLQEEFRKAAGF